MVIYKHVVIYLHLYEYIYLFIHLGFLRIENVLFDVQILINMQFISLINKQILFKIKKKQKNTLVGFYIWIILFEN